MSAPVLRFELLDYIGLHPRDVLALVSLVQLCFLCEKILNCTAYLLYASEDALGNVLAYALSVEEMASMLAYSPIPGCFCIACSSDQKSNRSLRPFGEIEMFFLCSEFSYVWMLPPPSSSEEELWGHT